MKDIAGLEMADAIDALADALGEVAHPSDVPPLGDDALLELTAAVESLGRRIDALRVHCAAEVGERSRRELGSERLSATKGCCTPAELLARVTRVAECTAVRRMRLGAGVRDRESFLGERMPADFPAVAVAMANGEIGIDTAQVITAAFGPIRGRAHPDDWSAAEEQLVADAIGDNGFTPDQTRVQALTWQVALDPDGAEQSAEEAMRQRGLVRVGTRGGLIRYRLDVMPEISGKLERALDAGLSPKTAPVFLDGQDALAADVADDRTSAQKRHDVFASLIDAASRSAELSTIGGAAPTVLVSVDAKDLHEGRGAGRMDGVEVPISMGAINQLACAGGIQRVVFDELGAVIALGSPDRIFTTQQRRAIFARDGGCTIPGCAIPAGWCEAHHVEEWSKGGATHTDNGVSLCWFHHRTIESSGWSVEMRHGVPFVRAPGWLDRTGTWRAVVRTRGRPRVPA